MIPVISTITSVLGYEQDEFWTYQPAVEQGAPITSWQWAGLPPGITANTATGAISGAATTQGVFIATVTATNASGSASLRIPIGIFARAWQNDGAIALDFDLTTGQVQPVLTGFKTNDPVIVAQQDETLIIDLGFTQNSGQSLIPIYPSEIRIAIKLSDTDAEPLCLSDGNFEVLGSYQSTRYRILLPLTGDLLAAAISDNEKDEVTVIKAFAEIRFLQPIEFNSEARLIPRSSLTFPVQIGKALRPI